MRLDLCLNCLEPGAQPIPIGHDKGSQRDPYRETLPLCSACEGALLEGRMETFHSRFAISRTVVRGEEV